LEAVAAELARLGRRSRARERRAGELARGAEDGAPTDVGPAPRLPGAEPGRRRRGWLLTAERLAVPGVLEVGSVRLAAGDGVALRLRLVPVGEEDRGLAPGEPVLDQLARVLGDDAARSRLAAAGLPYAAWTEPPERLSGGERARAGLALALSLAPD